MNTELIIEDLGGGSYLMQREETRPNVQERTENSIVEDTKEGKGRQDERYQHSND